MADTNSHSEMWNMPKTNPRGADFEKMISESHLQILNKENLENGWTWSGIRHGKLCKTIIDISFVSPQLLPFTKNFIIRNGVKISDHRSTEFIMNLNGATVVEARDFRKCDWLEFATLLDERQSTITSPYLAQGDVQRDVSCLYTDVYQILDIVCPKRKRTVRIPSIPFWTKELALLKEKKERIEKALYQQRKNPNKRHRKRYTRNQLMEVQKLYLKECKKAGHKSWQDFVKGTDSIKKVANLTRILKSIKDGEVGLLKDENGNELDEEGTVSLLVDTHFPGCKENPVAQNKLIDPLITVDINSPEVDFINPISIRDALNKFSPWKGAGPDELPPAVLQHFGPKTIDRLNIIYKACSLLRIMPDEWLRVKVIFIPKSGKDTYDVPGSYRPISLMQFMYKGWERLELWHHEDTTLQARPIHKNQHGFRKGFSTSTCLSEIVEEGEYGLIKDKYMLILGMDIIGAYNYLTFEKVRTSLEDKGSEPRYIDCVEYFLKHRRMYIEYKGIKKMRHPTVGVPQGSIISPCLWSEASESLLKKFDKGPVKAISYADDTNLYIIGKNPDLMRKQMQIHGIQPALEWAQENRMNFCPKKTKAIFIRRGKKFVLPPKMNLEGKPINYVDELKILGVTFDKRLDFKAHVKNKISSGKKLLFKIHGGQGQVWGMPPRSALYAYTGIIRPGITHGGLVWSPVTRYKSVQKDLRSFQLLALRMLGFSRRSTPARGLELITHTMPLHLHIQMLGAHEHLRTKHLAKRSFQEMRTRIPSRIGHRTFHTANLHRIGYTNTDVISDRLLVKQNWHKKFQINKSSMEPKSEFWGKPLIDIDYMKLMNTGPVNLSMSSQKIWEIYTDGSKNSETQIAGTGIVIYCNGLKMWSASYSIGDRSVFAAETYGIKKGALWLLNPENRPMVRGDRVLFYSDSQSTILALDGNLIDSKLIWETQKLLDEALKYSELASIELSWVKGHAGYFGNEEADRLAAIGTTLSISSDAPYMSERQINSGVTSCYYSEWERVWWEERHHKLTRTRQTRMFFPYLRPKFSFQLINHHREIYSMLVQLITGHNYAKRHQFFIDVARGEADPILDKDKKLCTLCGEAEESSHHILAECSRLMPLRLQIFGTHVLTPPFVSLKSSQLVSFLRGIPLEALKFFVDGERLAPTNRTAVRGKIRMGSPPSTR